MGLAINRLSKEDTDMAEQSTTAEVRVYRTVDGQLVGEGDPRGAFLAYGPGHTVPAGDVDAYNALVGRDHKAVADRANDGDDGARAKLRNLLAPPNRGPADAPPQMHDRLATELADEARVIANSTPETQAEVAKAADSDAVVATYPVYRTEDGDLVHEGHKGAATLAYGPGDRVADADVDQFNDLGDPPAHADESADETQAGTTPRTRNARGRRS